MFEKEKGLKGSTSNFTHSKLGVISLWFFVFDNCQRLTDGK